MAVFEHYRKEEHVFVEQVLEWKNAVETRYETKVTDFLDPREQDILASVIGKDEVVYFSFWGGAENCERKRAIIFPFYEQPVQEDFELALFKISYPSKFVTLSHRDILGSLTGLGVKRSKYGDILEGDGCFQFIATADIALFIEMNLNKVGRASVSIEKKPLDEIFPVDVSWNTVEATVSALRLDVMIAEMYHLSRSKTAPYIEKGRVKVNWKITDRSDFTLNPGDYISVRGLGRRKFLSAEGKTKKGKIRISYGKKEES